MVQVALVSFISIVTYIIYDGKHCIICALYQTCKTFVRKLPFVVVNTYSHLLATLKIWGSAGQKKVWRSTRPFFRRHQTKTEKAVWGRD